MKSTNISVPIVVFIRLVLTKIPKILLCHQMNEGMVMKNTQVLWLMSFLREGEGMNWKTSVFGTLLVDAWVFVTKHPILIDFQLVSQSGLGAGQVYARLGKSHWSALPSHSWRAEKKRIFSALKVKCLSRLDYKVERNRTSKELSKTRGQMSTWLLFSSFTIWSLQTD